MDIKKVFEDAGYECSSYSGRFMYGKKCLSIYLDERVSIGKFFSNVLIEIPVDPDKKYIIVDALAKMFEDMQIDNMGFGMVVYFPNTPWEDDDDAEDCDCID